MDLSSVIQQAQELSRAVAFMAGRIEALEAQNAALRHQLELIQQHGVAFTPATARAWIDSAAAADPVLWKRLSPGNSFNTGWDQEGGFPTGGTLRGLLEELASAPGDDSWQQQMWDIDMRQTNRPHLAGKYPPRFRKLKPLNDLMGDGPLQIYVQLTTGMRAGTKAQLYLETVFILFKGDAVRMLATEPLAVLQRVNAEIDRAYEPWRASRDRFMADFLSGQLHGAMEEKRARQVLGVEADATADQIKQAYRQLARQHHPDAGGDAEQFSRISTAYELLTA